MATSRARIGPSTIRHRRRVTAPIAAAYMGVSTSTFLARFRDHGRKEGANTLWVRAQLDRFIANQFSLPHDATEGRAEDRDTTWDDFS